MWGYRQVHKVPLEDENYLVYVDDYYDSGRGKVAFQDDELACPDEESDSEVSRINLVFGAHRIAT